MTSSKSISDASWTLFLTWVERYGMLFKRPVVAVPPQYTSQDSPWLWDKSQENNVRENPRLS